MKINRIDNLNNPHFGTKVIISPKVVERFCSLDEGRNLAKQVSLLEKNGVDDVLFFYNTSGLNVGAEVYYRDGKRLVSSHNIEEPFTNPISKKRLKSVNIVELYNKACNAIAMRNKNDKRNGIRIEKWLNNIPGVKE